MLRGVDGMTDYLRKVWQQEGQDVAEYMFMPAVILAIAVAQTD